MISKDLKKALGYVCKNRQGYVSDLFAHIGESCANQFASVGFITKGRTLNSDTWQKTSLADEYYKDLYGQFAHLLNRF